MDRILTQTQMHTHMLVSVYLVAYGKLLYKKAAASQVRGN